MRKFRLFFLVLILVLSGAGNALAEGFALYEYSARGVALGGGLVARTPDASSQAYNPAVIARLDGVNLMAGLTAITTGGDMDWKDGGASGSTSMKDAKWFIPHAYYTQKIGEGMVLGVGEYTRYGLGFEYPKNWPGNQNVYEISLTSFSVAPTLAFRATDKLSMALGLEVMHGSMDIKKRVNNPMAGGGQLDVSMSDMTDTKPGFNASLHYQFNDQWAAGLTYRSPIRAKLEGDVKFSNAGMPDAVFAGLQAMGYRNGSVSTAVTLPDSVSAGLAWMPTPGFSLEFGAVYTRWSTFDSLDFNMPNGLPVSENKKAWENVWRLNLSAEWQALDWLALRASYVYDESPMSEEYEDYLIPTNDRHIFSLGAGFQWQALTLDVAYGFIYAIGRDYNEDTRVHPDYNTHTLDSEAKPDPTHVLSLSLGYKF